MTQESTIQPFAPGDILVGCTLLNNSEDDHAGPGRIIQFDSDLNEKGVLWLEGTSHLIGGLKFAPDNTLWAFDSNAFAVIKVDTNGKQLAQPDFPKRSFSSVNFLDDGSVLLGEHMVGNEVKLPPDRPLGTTLARLPGEDKFGDGHIFRCSQDGDVITEYPTKTHGGMPGFLGVNNVCMSQDGKIAQYLSELSDGVYQYDIENNKQLDNLVTYGPEERKLAMCINRQTDGQLLHIYAIFGQGFYLNKLAEDGSVQKEYELPGPGWACLGNSIDPNVALLGNFFTGAVAKYDLNSGEFLAQGETGVERSIAGIAQFAG